MSIIEENGSPYLLDEHREFIHHNLGAHWFPFMTDGITAHKETIELDIHQYQAAMLSKNLSLLAAFPFSTFMHLEGNILDLGGGLGFYAAIFDYIGLNVTVIEKPIMSSVVSVAARESFRYFFADWKRFIGSEKFNYIFLSEVLHGRPEREIKRWLKLLPKLLKDGGCIFINEVDPRNLHTYCQAFDYRIKQMTNGQGMAISPEMLPKLTKSKLRPSCVPIEWAFYYIQGLRPCSLYPQDQTVKTFIPIVGLALNL